MPQALRSAVAGQQQLCIAQLLHRHSHKWVVGSEADLTAQHMVLTPCRLTESLEAAMPGASHCHAQIWRDLVM